MITVQASQECWKRSGYYPGIILIAASGSLDSTDKPLTTQGVHFMPGKGLRNFERIACVVDLDMIGFYNSAPNSQVVPPGFDVLFPDAVEQIRKNNSRGDFIINTYNTASTEFGSSFEKNAKANVPDLRVISLEAPDDGVGTPELIASDHYPFWKKRYTRTPSG